MVPGQLFPQGSDKRKKFYTAFDKLNLFHFIKREESFS